MSSSIRFVVGAVVALMVTLSLFFIMKSLIGRPPEVNEDKMIKVVDIRMPKLEIDVNIKKTLPDKPDVPDVPPPDFNAPVATNVAVNTNLSSSYNARSSVKIDGIKMSASDGEYLPIVKVAPIYPSRAQTRGVEGHCTVEYAVTTSGAIRDPFIVEDDCSSSMFHRASLKAALKFKYKPRVIDGEPVEVTGVRNRFTYQLEK